MRKMNFEQMENVSGGLDIHSAHQDPGPDYGGGEFSIAGACAVFGLTRYGMLIKGVKFVPVVGKVVMGMTGFCIVYGLLS